MEWRKKQIQYVRYENIPLTAQGYLFVLLGHSSIAPIGHVTGSSRDIRTLYQQTRERTRVSTIIILSAHGKDKANNLTKISIQTLLFFLFRY